MTLVSSVVCLLLCLTLLSYSTCCRGAVAFISKDNVISDSSVLEAGEDSDVPEYDVADAERMWETRFHQHHHHLHHKQRRKESEAESLPSSSLNSAHNYHNYTSDVHPTRKLPNVIIIGVKKAGTRALLEFLKLHPNVRATGPEPHFFDKNYERGLEWYRSQMPSTLPHQLTMEKTPSYFIRPEVPARVLAMSRDVKLVLVVRDPVIRALSDYAQTASKKNRMRSFEELAFTGGNGSRVVDTSWSAIKIGVYAKYLENWLRYFPLHQIHFVSGERLVSDPAEEMARLQDFLRLTRVVTNKHFYFNDTKGFPCLVKSESSPKPHCLNKNKGRQHPQVDDDVLQRLRDFYRPFNQKFYQISGIDFGWP